MSVSILTGGDTGNRHITDFYPTPPSSTQTLIDTGLIQGYNSYRDPCAGQGHITEVLRYNGYNNVSGEDLYDYNPPSYIKTGVNFLYSPAKYTDCIVTNPPYDKKILLPFVKKCLAESNITAMFLKITFLESQKRKRFFDSNRTLRYILPFSNRQPMYKAGIPTNQSNAIMYAWFVWDKSYNGDPSVRLIDSTSNIKKFQAMGFY